MLLLSLALAMSCALLFLFSYQANVWQVTLWSPIDMVAYDLTMCEKLDNNNDKICIVENCGPHSLPRISNLLREQNLKVTCPIPFHALSSGSIVHIFGPLT